MLFGLAVTSCGPWPDPQFDDTAARAAPFPLLVPIDTLVSQAPATAAPDGPPASRIAALNARAARLRGPVVDSATRARMRAGVNTSALR